MFGIDDALMVPLAGAALGAVGAKNPLKGAAVGGALGAVPGIFGMGAGAAGSSGITSGLLSSGAPAGGTGLTASAGGGGLSSGLLGGGAAGGTGMTLDSKGITGLTNNTPLDLSKNVQNATGIFSPESLKGLVSASTIAAQTGIFDNGQQAPQVTSAGIPNKGSTDFTSLMQRNDNQPTGAQKIALQRKVRHGY